MASVPHAGAKDDLVASAQREESGSAEAPKGGASQPNGAGNVFKLHKSTTTPHAHGVHPSKIKATRTEAALHLYVVDKAKGPIEGIVISLIAPNGTKYYTEETDAEGYAETLVPVGQTYEVVYLSLGRHDISAKVTVENKPNFNLKLTLRYSRQTTRTDNTLAPRFVLKGVEFATGKATLTPESFARLDTVVEYMAHKKSARIEISGHTDNVGNSRVNKKLSKRRAEACRDYLVSKGIDGNRIETVGYGDERPIAPNDTEEGRQKNRRIEATEL